MEHGFLEAALKMSMALGIVLVIFAACVYVFKKFPGFSQVLNKKGKRAVEKPIDVLCHHSLGPGRSLYLVKCGSKRILIGATNQSICQVATLDDNQVDEFDFESSLKEEADGSAGSIRKDFGRGLKEIARV